MTYLVHDAAGRITSETHAPVNEPGMTSTPAPAGWDGDTNAWWMDGATLAARPAPVTVALTGPAPHSIPLDGFAPGTSFRVVNEAGTEMTWTDRSAPLRLIDPGRYVLFADQPFPHHEFGETIEVTDA